MKMLAGIMKQRFRSMGRPCESSWTGVHANFQVREYNAGASPTSSEHGTKRQRILAHDELFEMF